MGLKTLVLQRTYSTDPESQPWLDVPAGEGGWEERCRAPRKHRKGIGAVKLFVICTDNRIHSYPSWLGCCLHNDVATAVQVRDYTFENGKMKKTS